MKRHLKTLKSRIAVLQPTLRGPSERLTAGGRRPGSVATRWSGRKLQEWRARILANEPLCRHCKAKGLVVVAREVDHEVPLEAGGTYDDSNAQPLCVDCHKAKTAEESRLRASGGPRGGA